MNFHSESLKKKVALVTGGNGGLGERICYALAKAGVDVAVVGGSNIDRAKSISKDIKNYGVDSAAFSIDLQEPEQITQLVNDVCEHFGGIDILINNAAFTKAIEFKDLQSINLELWDKIISINLKAPMILCKEVSPIMMDRGGGHIVNISSISGIAPSGSCIPYSISKAGLNHLTKCMAVALSPNILVNGIAPGLMEDTWIIKQLTPEHIARSKKTSLLQKATDKDDVASQVLTICKSKTMTGQTIIIDSGRVFS